MALQAILTVTVALVADSATSEAEPGPEPVMLRMEQRVPDGKTATYHEVMQRFYGLYVDEKLLKTGKLLEWGVSHPMVYESGGENVYTTWFRFRDMSAVDDFRRETIEANETRRRDHPLLNEAIGATIDVGSRSSSMWVDVRSVDASKITSKADGYTWFLEVRALPGHHYRLEEKWAERFSGPLASLLQTGTITNHGLSRDELPSGAGSVYRFWFAVASMRKYGEAMRELRGAASHVHIEQAFAGLIEPNDTRRGIDRNHIYQRVEDVSSDVKPK